MMHSIGKDLKIEVTEDEMTPEKYLKEKIDSSDREDSDDAFYVVDMADILLKHKKWVTLLPRVEPFYAVKCNNDPMVLKLLVGLGLGFDCASKVEIQTMLNLGVPPSKIVYANPCKQASHIRFASQHDVSLTTFDNEMELHKIKKFYPTSRLLLRVRTDDSKSLCQLGIKFGAPLKQCCHLLKVASDLGLNVVGVSFHVGSGCFDSSAYHTAVQAARSVFDIAMQFGFHMNLLDIGGGFPGAPNAPITFEEVCVTLAPLLDELFPVSSGVRIIAEPGRYYSASAFTLAVNVYSKRTVLRSQMKEKEIADIVPTPGGSEELGYMYYVNDGVYGSFNCLVFDHATVEPKLVHDSCEQERFPSSIWGPSCDSMDCIAKEVMLPKMAVGDWLYFENMGAYTHSAASTFNGFKKPIKYYIIHQQYVNILKPALEPLGGKEAKSLCHMSSEQFKALGGLPNEYCPGITTGAM